MQNQQCYDLRGKGFREVGSYALLFNCFTLFSYLAVFIKFINVTKE
jgi:hypothetical protein